MGTTPFIIGLVVWLAAFAIVRRVTVSSFRAGTLSSARAALSMGFVWALVPLGFAAVRPEGTQIGVAAAAAVLLGLGAFAGTKLVLDRHRAAPDDRGR